MVCLFKSANVVGFTYFDRFSLESRWMGFLGVFVQTAEKGVRGKSDGMRWLVWKWGLCLGFGWDEE